MEELYPEYKEKSSLDKLTTIASEAPMVPVGLLALITIVSHGVFTFRKRKIKPSLFLIHYRLAAQGTFLGCLTFGLAYTVFRRHFWKKAHDE